MYCHFNKLVIIPKSEKVECLAFPWTVLDFNPFFRQLFEIYWSLMLNSVLKYSRIKTTQ